MTQQGSKENRGSGASRRTRIVLVVSLALNLFVLALVIGASIGHPRWRPPHGGVRDVGVGLFTDVLSRKDRAALRDAFIAAAPDFREQRRGAQEDFAALSQALRATDWDVGRVDAIIARQSSRITERLELGRRLLRDRFSEMTPQERAELADRIDERLQRGWRH